MNPNAGDIECVFKVSKHVTQLLSIMFKQMCFPHDFDYDYENENDAEEIVYHSGLYKLNQKIVPICPELYLQFDLSQVKTPLSPAHTSEVEAALRLVYHYCDGIRHNLPSQS